VSESGESSQSEEELQEQQRYLLLSHRRRVFGLSLEMVRRISELAPLSPVPLAPPYVKGLMSEAGAIITVMDIGQLLGLPDARTGDGTVVLILDLPQASVGLLAEKVIDLAEIHPATISPAPPITGNDAAFFAGSCQLDGAIIDLLDDRRIAEVVLMAGVEQQTGGEAAGL